MPLAPGTRIGPYEVVAQIGEGGMGLAKAMESPISPHADATHSPTLSMQATMAGAILGTAAYMSPEQVSGKRRGSPKRPVGLRRRVVRNGVFA